MDDWKFAFYFCYDKNCLGNGSLYVCCKFQQLNDNVPDTVIFKVHSFISYST